MQSMLEIVSGWLVQQPVHMLLLAAAHLLVWAMGSRTVLRTRPKSNVLWIPALLWLAFAGWEWLLLARSPDANIRVDLLLIVPVIGLVTFWALVRAARAWWSASRPDSS